MFAGCGLAPQDPCDGQAGTCITVDVRGDVGPIDAVQLTLSGALTGQVTSKPSRAPTPLPVAVGLLVKDATGDVAIVGVGLLSANPVGFGRTVVYGLAPGAHARTVLELGKQKDSDGDGDPDTTDCAPSDPKIHHPTAGDPFPESPNCCGYSFGKKGADAAKSFATDPTCHAAACDDGVDQDCDGMDVACAHDQDCDGALAGKVTTGKACAAPLQAPPGKDCNDCDPAINPLAPEVCGDGIDNNCNGLTDETCVNCDLDGDGFQRMDAKSGCPNAMTDLHPGKVDCNDEDAGVYPGSTSTPTRVPSLGNQTCQAIQGQSAACALRMACRSKNPDGSRQDVDCNGIADDGCPMNDMDGDGFAPPTDCNDMDATVFPGAPDKCGDGVAQNCIQDTPCATDGDGDHYNAADDCDDKDPAVHPWAVEPCNGRDDDCDGLVDEGNPDATGVAMAAQGAVLHCNDVGLGECKPLTGDCVCSATPIANLSFDQASRTACPGENDAVDTGARSGLAAPRCYFAPQPGMQTCDPMNPTDGDCDGRVDAPDGKNLALVGQPCWAKPVGACKGGLVVGCDMTQKNCFAGFGVNPWLTCDASAVCPTAEKCNGLDDDCNGAVPAIENDADGDGYLACGSPYMMYASGGACSPPLRMGAAGCGDCQDGNKLVHPGAKDVCNAVDDDCNPTTPDGAADCPGPSPMPECCAGACKMVATDLANCGGCNITCAVANGTPKCVNAACAVASCTAPFADCDLSYANGCETNTTSSALHCGNCATSCAANVNGHACVASVCGCNAAGDCGATGDACTMNKCMCGLAAPCNPATQQCVAGMCLLLSGQPCTLGTQCASMICKVQGNMMKCQ